MNATMMTMDEFFEYVHSFYGTGGLYDMGATRKQIERATDIYLAQPGTDFAADSFDREHVRDILIEQFGLKWPGGA